MPNQQIQQVPIMIVAIYTALSLILWLGQGDSWAVVGGIPLKSLSVKNKLFWMIIWFRKAFEI